VDGVELPRVLTLLWQHDQPARRGPKPKYSIREIGAAGVRVADAEGLAAVSMSRVAAELGLTTMALYRYVDAKDDLLVAMIDTAYGPPPRSRAGGDWRAQLGSWASSNRGALARHPWVVQIPLYEPPLGPNTLAWMERGLRAFERTPLGEQEKLSALLLVEVYVRGQALLSTALETDPGGSDESSEAEQYVRRLAQLVDPDGFPAITAAMLSGAMQDKGDARQDEFAFGLDVVLDGIAALIARKQSR
jgi:AcrR family transcriptional regulator